MPDRKTRGNKYCSRECEILGRRKYKIKNEQIKWADKEKTRIDKWRGEKICIYCGKKFQYTSKNIHQKYCSVICQVKNRAHKVNESFFDKIDSESKAYFLGLMFSDGNISSKKHYINIASNDKGLIETCKNLLETDSPIHSYQKYFYLIICNRNLHKSLRDLGILTRKSWKELSIPSIPKKLIRHFLRGIYDGDGSFYLDKRENNRYIYLCASLTCGSYQFIEQIKNLVETQLNITFHQIRFDNKGENKGSYQLRLSRQIDLKKFTNYLYQDATYYLKRKYNFVKNFYHGQI